MNNEEIKDLVTDYISRMDIDYEDIENGNKIDFEMNNGDVLFEGKVSSYKDNTKPGCGCDSGSFDVEGVITVLTEDGEKKIDYDEKGFGYEYITDYYSYYGVKQSDFI